MYGYDQLESPTVPLSGLIGGGYRDFWNSKDTYVVCKGSKGSKKSATQAHKIIYNMMRYPLANTLVLRKVGKTMRNTVFTEVRWAIEHLGVSNLWRVNMSEMKLEYIPTGQVILFFGLDDPLKLASIKVLHGFLCWVWFEEAADITNYADVLKIMMSIRGKLPPGYYKQFTFTFNPWSEHHWLKEEFFDKERDDAYVCTTTFRDNEFLGADDLKRYYDLYRTSPRMARVICDGEWGIAEGLIYDNWVEEDFNIADVLRDHPNAKPSCGLDFGYKISYNAFVAILVDFKEREMWIYDEYYEHGQSNIDLAKKIIEMGYGKEEIWADSAEPKSIDELRKGLDENIRGEDGSIIESNHYALPNIKPALKGPDSIQNGIQRMQSMRIHVHPCCINTIIEFNNYAWDTDKDGKSIDKPIKEWDHCLVAGTMVLTDHGEVPIENIEVGDMVMTHLGYRRVLASGVTRPEPAEIWRVTLEDGRVLEGTVDHPILTMDGLKYLGTLTSDLEVISWEDQSVNVEKQSVSNLMDITGTDTPILKINRTECTITVHTNQKEKHSCIDIFGRKLMETSPNMERSIILTETPSTTTSPTSYVFPTKSTPKHIHGQMNVEQKGQRKCATKNLYARKHVECGMPQRKDINGMSSMPEKSQQNCKTESINASNVERLSGQSLAELIVSAPMLANQHLEERRGSMTLTTFVQSVAKSSVATNMPKESVAVENVLQSIEDVASKCKPVRVVSVEKTTRFEYVYDITVEEAHTFFANNLITGNCLDAARYALTKFYIRGKGHVAEAKGSDLLEMPSGPAVEKPRKSRRVISAGTSS